MWLNAQGIAIWYMDDGCININTSSQRSSIQHTIKFATCTDEVTTKIIIDYFYDIWNIKFRPFKEGKDTFSIATSSEIDCSNFIKIIKPYIIQLPSMWYKIRNNYTKEYFINLQNSGSEVRNILF